MRGLRALGDALSSPAVARIVGRDAPAPVARVVCGERVARSASEPRVTTHLVTLGAPAPLLVRLSSRKATLDVLPIRRGGRA